MANTQVQELIEENLLTQNPTLDLGCCGLDGTEPMLIQIYFMLSKFKI